MSQFRPRRSVLYMPASNARALERAKTLAADALILDLEDAVAPDAKGVARDLAVAAVRGGGYGSREVVIRINSLSTEWGTADLDAAIHAAPNAILVPKVSSATTMLDIGQRLAARNASSGIRLWAMIETPAAILAIERIAMVARDPVARLSCFVMGTNDLAKETRARMVPGRAPMLPWLMQALAAARAEKLDIIDGVFNAISDMEGFTTECRQGQELGFDGKTLIHPSQIEIANQAFAPSAMEVADARAIIDAFALPENASKGAITLNGRMVERLHADMAARIVALAEAITDRAK
jgi:citrate lyase subunit beta/citryl-CoA lyase